MNNKLKINAVYAMGVDRNRKIEEVGGCIFKVFYGFQDKFHTSYFLVMNGAEHEKHIQECTNLQRLGTVKPGYELFMYYWRYCGMDGSNYVYSLIQYDTTR